MRERYAVPTAHCIEVQPIPPLLKDPLPKRSDRLGRLHHQVDLRRARRSRWFQPHREAGRHPTGAQQCQRKRIKKSLRGRADFQVWTNTCCPALPCAWQALASARATRSSTVELTARPRGPRAARLRAAARARRAWWARRASTAPRRLHRAGHRRIPRAAQRARERTAARAPPRLNPEFAPKTSRLAVRVYRPGFSFAPAAGST